MENERKKQWIVNFLVDIPTKDFKDRARKKPGVKLAGDGLFNLNGTANKYSPAPFLLT